MLPGIAELTTGVSAFNTPAYSVGMHSVSPVHSSSDSPYLPNIPMPYYQPTEPPGSSKHGASPGPGYREVNRQRHMDFRYDEAGRGP